MNLTEKLKFRKFVNNLKKYRGRHTELISVYLPPKTDLSKQIQTLYEEQGTATNIKDKNTGKAVITALERMIRTLKTFKELPPNGIAIFSGNVSEKENVDNCQVFWIEPPMPIPLKLYRCEQRFVTAPLEDMASNDTTYGLIVIDKSEATVGLLVGSQIKVVRHLNSTVPGKFRTGGQCLLPESIVQMSDGSIKQIKNIKVGDLVKSMNFENFSLKDSTVTDKWIVSKNEIVKITTKTPKFEIECSKDHILFVKKNNDIYEVAAENLNQGDILILPEFIKTKSSEATLNSYKYYNEYEINEKGKKLIIQKRIKLGLSQRQLANKLKVTLTTISSYEIGKINIKRENLIKLCKLLDLNQKSFLKFYCKPSSNVKLPNKLTPQLSQILGYFIANGNFEKEGITILEQREEVALCYKNLLEKLFNAKVSFKKQKDKDYFQIRVYEKPITRFFKNEFKEIKNRKELLIPKKVLVSSSKVLSSFLKGFYDAKSYISKKSIKIKINNKILARQTQVALLRFGIISSITLKNNNTNNYNKINTHLNETIYIIEISEKKSMIEFIEKIGFSSKEKNLEIKKKALNKSFKSNISKILTTGNEVKKIIKKQRKNLHLFSSRVDSFLNNSNNIGKKAFINSITRVLSKSKLKEYLIQIVKFNALSIKIDKIEIKNQKVKMIDISVENENFIANGIVVHNSAQRFERIREGAAIEFYKRVADVTIQEFTFMKDLKGIIIGGPGTTKNNFIDGNYLNEEIKKKIIGVKDITYTNAFGLKELVDKSQDLLLDSQLAEEKKILLKFFETLSKKTEYVIYGKEEAEKALELGAVEDLILIDECVDDTTLNKFSELAKLSKTKIHLITDNTPEGMQLKGLGGIGGILRYPIN